MKHVKLFEGFLLESMDIDGIYQKYYSDIPYEDYIKIVECDPTYKPSKRTKGLYMKWLLGLYKQDKLLIEDLYKATNYLGVYHQYQRQINYDIKNVNSLPELLSLVEPFMPKEDSIFTNDEERQLAGQFEQVYKDDKWRIIIPLTLKASKYFGKGTQWCTTNTDSFNHYTEKQKKGTISIYNLYILIPTDGNMNQRLQFHFNTRQFMDIKDAKIDKDKFFIDNPFVYNFFDKYFPVLKYTKSYEFYKKGKRLTKNDKKSIQFIDNILKKLSFAKNDKYIYDFYIDTNDDNKAYIINADFWGLSCRWNDFWRILENNYNLNDEEIKGIVRSRLEYNFKKEFGIPRVVFKDYPSSGWTIQ